MRRLFLVLCVLLWGWPDVATTIYEQTWTAGTFAYPGTSSAANTDYPELGQRYSIKTVAGGGPSGVPIVDLDSSTGGTYNDVGAILKNVGNVGGYWDSRGAYYEITVKFSSAAQASAGDSIFLFAIAAATNVAVNDYSTILKLTAALTSGQLRLNRTNLVGYTVAASITADDAWHVVKVYLTPSSDGGTTPDGVIRIWIDGAMVYEDTASNIFVPTVFGNAPFMLNNVVLGRFGMLPTARFRIYTLGEEVPPNNSTPCCGDTVDPSSGGTTPGDVIPPDPSVTLPPWTRACDGGGTVPTAPDALDAESWVF